MHPLRQIEAIKAEFGGRIAPSEIRAATRAAEVSTPIGAILSTVSSREFLPALLEAAAERPLAEERAWLTLAAAGRRDVVLALAWRASQLLDAGALVEVFVDHRDQIREECERRAAAARCDEVQGPWLLLADLSRGQLRRLVRGRPRLRGELRRQLAERRARRDHDRATALALA